MTLFLEVYPLSNWTLKTLSWTCWMVELSISVCAVVIVTPVSQLGVVGVAVGGSVQCCSFYSLCNRSLELVKGMSK